MAKARVIHKTKGGATYCGKEKKDEDSLRWAKVTCKRCCKHRPA